MYEVSEKYLYKHSVSLDIDLQKVRYLFWGVSKRFQKDKKITFSLDK